MPEKETISYHLPPLGNALVTLHDESAEIYRFLELSGEAARLRKLDHLGLVRVAWSGAHHPRWEYVVTILYLIERCKDVSEVHLGTAFPLSSGDRVSSGSELLKSWALLTNVGHLFETFSAERALLLEILRDRSHIRDELFASFEGTGLEKWVRRILKEFRVHQFFQALTFIRLRDLAKALSIDDRDTERWLSILGVYVKTEDETTSDQLVVLKRVYRNLRRLAYLGLDSHYTPSVVDLNLAQVATGPWSSRSSSDARRPLFNCGR